MARTASLLLLVLLLGGCSAPGAPTVQEASPVPVVESTPSPSPDPAEAAKYFKSGKGLFEGGATAEALEQFNQAVALDPENVDALYYRGRSREKTDDSAGAVEDFTAALALDPERADLYFYRGTSLLLLGKVEEAVADFQKADELGWGTEAIVAQGMAHMSVQDYEQAVDDFTRAIEAEPESSQAYYQRARAYQKLGRKASAAADFEKARKFNATLPVGR